MGKHNFLKKIKSIILVTALLLSSLAVCSCTNKNNNPPSNTTTATESNATEAPARAENNGVSLAEQTIIDEETGITVSGMLPENADMHIIFTSKEFMRLSDNFELTIQHEVHNPTADELANRTQAYNPIEYYSSTDWSLSTDVLEPDGVPCIEVYFVKEYEVLDFESEFTITAPIDFRTFAKSRQSDNNMTALLFDNDTCTFFKTEVLPESNTPANSLSFKAYTPGKYCFGNDEFLGRYLRFYNLELSQLKAYTASN